MIAPRSALHRFVGITGAPGPEHLGPTEREHEKNDRPLAIMLAPCAALIFLALAPASWGEQLAQIGAVGLPGSTSASGSAETTAERLAPIGLTLALLGCSLVRRRPTTIPARRLAALEMAPFGLLQRLHSGLIGDYVAWLALGLAVLATACL